MSQISKSEDGKSKADKPYTRFQTDTDGWVSCWDTTLSKELKEYVNNGSVELEIVTKGNYKNIVGFKGGAKAPQAPATNPKLEQEIGYYARKTPDVFNTLVAVLPLQEDAVKRHEELEYLADFSAHLVMRMKAVVEKEMKPYDVDDVEEEIVQ